MMQPIHSTARNMYQYFAITMGVGTNMAAKEIFLMALGDGKAEIPQAVEGPVKDVVPSSFLQNHPTITFIVDSPVAAHPTRFKSPWLVGQCVWTDRMIRKAVLWLCTSNRQTAAETHRTRL